MGRLIQRMSDWATIAKLAAVADLLFKFAALVAALAAANFFYFQPSVQLTTNAQAFVDLAVLSESYATAHQSMRAIVADVAEEYNRRNRHDLDVGDNTTGRSTPLPSELCARMRRTVERVFLDADCNSSSVVLGRGRYYERLLLDRSSGLSRPLSVTQLREAIAHMHRAEYRRARTRLKNVGNAKAANVRIRISDGFVPRTNQANDPFSLDSGQQFRRDFETARGDYEEHPSLEFGVDWDRGGISGARGVLWLITFMIAALLLVIVNDMVRSSRDDAGR